MSLDTISHFRRLKKILKKEGLDSMLYYDNTETRIRNKSYDLLIGVTITSPSRVFGIFSKNYSVFYSTIGTIEKLDRKKLEYL